MKIYDFLADGNTIEIQYGKHLTKYATFSNGALRWAKNTDTLNGLLINSLQDKLNKTFTDVYPEDFTIKRAIVRLYDPYNTCLLHNKTIDEAENFIKNYNPAKTKKDDNSNMTINDFLAQGGSIDCTWNVNIKCRKIVTSNDFTVADDITLGDLTHFLWQHGRCDSKGTSRRVNLKNRQYNLYHAGGKHLIKTVGKSKFAELS